MSETEPEVTIERCPMMSEELPVNDQVRARLREAQKSEANALRAVVAAQKARERQQARLDRASDELAARLVTLVEVSGILRAARLTGEDAKTLRDGAREAGLKPSQLQ